MHTQRKRIFNLIFRWQFRAGDAANAPYFMPQAMTC